MVVTLAVLYASLTQANLIHAGAQAQLVHPAKYDASYHRIPYPGGDVDPTRGACSDVVVRAFRAARIDLQREIFEDSAARAYPRIDRRDPNIDHRRVKNIVTWLERHAQTLATDRDWNPGDVVVWVLDSGLDHIGIVSANLAARGRPRVVHNIWQTAEEDVLFKWRVVGHYRLPD